MARAFDGAASQYLQVTSVPVTAAPCTFSAWVYWTGTVFQSGTAIGIADSSVTNHWFILRAVGNGATMETRFSTRAGGGFNDAISAGKFAINTWVHICGVEIATNSRAAYVNGAGKGTNVTNAVPAGLDTTSIGRTPDSSPSDYFYGFVAEPTIWNVALTDAEVHRLYQGCPPWLIHPRSLVGFWLPFGEYNDRDYTRRYHMSAFNTPTWTNQDPHHVTSFRARAQFEPFASSRRRMSYGRYPGNLITRPWAYAPAAPVGGNPWYAYAQQ